MPINAGFIGYGNIAGKITRCNDFGVNKKQDILFYDHIIGLRDTIPTSISTIKGDGGDKNSTTQYNPQAMFYRYGTYIYQGGFTFPLTSNCANLLWEEARGGKDFNSEFFYGCNDVETYSNCKVNSYNLKIANGDVVTSSIDIIAISSNVSSSSHSLNTTSEALLKWDDVEIKFDNTIVTDLANLEFTINNSCIPIYTANKLEAGSIRVGIQRLSGIVSSYGALSSFPSKIDIKIGNSFSIKLDVLWKPTEKTASVGALIQQNPFVGNIYNIVV